MAERVVRVLLPQAGRALFDYTAPQEGRLERGQLVRVPLGKRLLLGVVWALDVTPEVDPARLKPIAEVWSDWPPLDAALLDQIAFASSYYLNAAGEYLAFVLPPALRRRRRQTAAAKLLAAGILKGEQRGDRERHAVRDQLGEERAADGAHSPRPEPLLTPEQQQALAAMSATSGFDPVLLYGVTGSGKTELYLRRIAATVARGQQALLLVPEIGLVPQTAARCRERLPTARVALWHSDLSRRERQSLFAALVSGAVDLVIGTRSAIFTPLPRLGLIVVDEEHDASYRQFEGAPYSARDLALWRGKRCGVPVILGSATPSLERWWDAERGRMRRVVLTHRATGVALPEIALVDLRRTAQTDEGLAPAVWEEIAATVARDEQVLLFLNRRGYAPTLYCGHCGWVQSCARCSVRMVFHRVDQTMRCHHCGWSAPVPTFCPSCGSGALAVAGRGTQRLEAALGKRFPGHNVLRIDRDSCRDAQAFAAVREAIAARRAHLLIGTQMLAKGHDFPALALVVVAGADAGLMAADARASERLMQQLLQVAGRAGRAGRTGRVLVQTHYPDHPFYQQLVAHDYSAFAAATLAERARLGLPPYGHQAVLRADAPELSVATAFLTEAKRLGAALCHQMGVGGLVRLMDVVPLRIVRVAERERAQLLVEAPDRQALHPFLQQWVEALAAIPLREGLRWRLEVDPLEV